MDLPYSFWTAASSLRELGRLRALRLLEPLLERARRGRGPSGRAPRTGSSSPRAAAGPRRRTCARCGTGRCRGRRRRRPPWRRAGCRRWRGCPAAGSRRPSPAASRTSGRAATAPASACPPRPAAPRTGWWAARCRITSPVLPSIEMASPSFSVLAADLQRLGPWRRSRARRSRPPTACPSGGPPPRRATSCRRSR